MIEIFDIEQGTSEWLEVRAGIPTASRYADVIAKKGPRGGIPKGRQTYMYKLAGEILTGEPMDNWTSAAMDLGHEREAEARDMYSFVHSVQVEQTGFIRNGYTGCSPDGLVGEVGLFENKNAAPHIQIDRLLKGVMPAEHVAQVQGQLMVAERQWCDFQSYCRGLPPLVIRVDRDDKYIAELRVDVGIFVEELNQLLEKIGSM